MTQQGLSKFVGQSVRLQHRSRTFLNVGLVIVCLALGLAGCVTAKNNLLVRKNALPEAELKIATKMAELGQKDACG